MVLEVLHAGRRSLAATKSRGRSFREPEEVHEYESKDLPMTTPV